MQDCIFCKIVKGEIPSAKIYEDEKTLAFLDIAPVNIGHTLVIPKEHFRSIYEIPENLLAETMKTAKKISGVIKNTSDGVNVTINNGGAAGQIIFHFHVHVIPRLASDGFGPWHGRRPYKEGEMQEVARKISSQIL